MGDQPRRLDYIDWMRGLACLLMFQTHAYDAWLGPVERQSRLFHYSQLLGTLPAPLFLFLAGVSLAFGVDCQRNQGVAGAQIARSAARRGLWIFLLGLLFRLQEYALAFGWAPWTDLFRVDILNAIGVSLIATSLVLFMAHTPGRQVTLAASLALAVALLTPPLWTTHKPDFLPWWLASYINGGHTNFVPRPGFFPLFPWTAFTLAGCAAGATLIRAVRKGRERGALLMLGAAGVILVPLGLWLDSVPVHLYAVHDFWHTSPNFFLVRLGVLMVVLLLCYGWCTLRPGKFRSPVQQLGTTSLLVYWIHIDLVYGRFSILPKRSSSIEAASLGLGIITVAMLLLSILRTDGKGRGAALWTAMRRRIGLGCRSLGRRPIDRS